jgi:hypothetical protein
VAIATRRHGPARCRPALSRRPSLLVVLLVWVVVLAWTARQKRVVWRWQSGTRPGPTIDELEHDVLDGFLFHDDCRWCRLELAYESTRTQ